MSKYRAKGGAYHWREFDKQTPYREHVLRVLDWIPRPPVVNSILDIGAGDGLITYQLKQCGYEVVGIDNDFYAIQTQEAAKAGVKYGAADPDGLFGSVKGQEWLRRPFDAVFLGDVIEHFKKPQYLLQDLHEITQRLFIVTPPPTLPDKWAVKQYSLDSLCELLEDNGWLGQHWQTVPDRIYVEAKCLSTPSSSDPTTS